MITINKDKAIEYANRTCVLDGTFCASVALNFYNKNEKEFALQYVERACELGEPLGCGGAFEAYSGQWESKDIKKDIKKARYYKAKLCEAGYKDYCR